MFKYRAIKKYGSKLLPVLEKRYGKQTYYSARQVRTSVYQKDFKAEFLPLGYILFLEDNELNNVMEKEFPDLSIPSFKTDIVNLLNKKQYHGFLNVLNQH